MTQRRKPPSRVDRKTAPVPAAVRRGKSRTLWRLTMAAIAVVIIGAVVWALRPSRPETRSRSALEAAKTVPPDPVTPDMEITVADALRRARDNVLRDPTSSDAWSTLAALCDAHDLNDCAETCYERAYDLGRDDLMLIYNLGVVYELRGRPDDALAMLQRAQKMEPGFPGTYWRLGELYAREGRFEAAREAFSRALAIEPTHLLALRGLGSVLIQLSEVEASLEPLEQVAAAAPGDGPTFAHLARAYARLGRTKDAEVALEQSRRLGSASPLVLADPIRFEVDRLRMDSISLRERAECRCDPGTSPVRSIRCSYFSAISRMQVGPTPRWVASWCSWAGPGRRCRSSKRRSVWLRTMPTSASTTALPWSSPAIGSRRGRNTAGPSSWFPAIAPPNDSNDSNDSSAEDATPGESRCVHAVHVGVDAGNALSVGIPQGDHVDEVVHVDDAIAVGVARA